MSSLLVAGELNYEQVSDDGALVACIDWVGTVDNFSLRSRWAL